MKSRRMQWAVHLAHVRFKRNRYKVLIGKPDGRRPFE
jgi:hypothetical protein